MARAVFFSFHYERDIWRASQVRNSGVTQGAEAAGFWDAASWEGVKKKGDAAIKQWIDAQLYGTSVTVVLIGSQTADREYVLYEIERSYEEGKGMLGVYIHNMKDVNGFTAAKGTNPFDRLTVLDENAGRNIPFSRLYTTYDWIQDDGYSNFGDWVEEAARDAGR